MRNRSIIAVSAVVAVVVLIGAAVALYVVDRSSRDRIAKGVTVAGIQVGGLDAAQARARLERRYLAPLGRPVRVVAGGRTFTLTARESHVAADVGAIVDAALHAGRSQGIFTRAWREVSGARLDVDVDPRPTFSRAAVTRLVDRVRVATDRPATSASVRFSVAGARVQPAQEGRAVLVHQLRLDVEHAIVDPRGARTISARTRRSRPPVTTSDVDRTYSTLLVVDRKRFRLRLYKDLKLRKVYKVAVGAVGLETPAGLYHIQNKAVDPAWTEPHSSWVPAADRGKVVPGGAPDNPLKARWLGIFDGAGIHGIDPSEYGTIGHAASHGCVRMRIPDVIDLYPQVRVGTPIYIA
jgi:lipoprotein-anchoring transpeptidase ErfK/SrfK